MKIKWYKNGKFHKEESFDLTKTKIKYIFRKKIIKYPMGNYTFFVLYDRNDDVLSDIHPLEFRSQRINNVYQNIPISEEDIELIKSNKLVISINNSKLRWVRWDDIIRIISENDITFE
jgi:hypothetical protein